MAVGDRAIVSEGAAGSWAIEDIQPRRTLLARPDPFLAPRQQVIAANVDQLLAVSSWRSPDLWLELIDRYLIAAGLSEIEPVICINKVDLVDDQAEYESATDIYRRMGHKVLRTSATTGLGIDDLRDILTGKLTVVVGLSGTGKSSLMAAVQPGLDIRVGRISEAHRQGTHTTTQSKLYKLDVGGYVADTPGIREFGIAGLTLGELPLYFPEVDELAAECKFSNCSHLEEPECAVRAAEIEGRVCRGHEWLHTEPYSMSLRCRPAANSVQVQIPVRPSVPETTLPGELQPRLGRPGRRWPAGDLRLRLRCWGISKATVP